MRGSAPLSNEGYSLLLDIYLGGVSGALVKNSTLEQTVHNKTLIPDENIPVELLHTIELLVQKTIEELISKKQISKTYIFIDMPLSYTELHEVIFQNDDKTFFDTKLKEIDSEALTLPTPYTNLLQGHVSDGVVVEHPPKNHTLNGYTTSNLSLVGERKAQIAQQWIQRNVYTAIQKAKNVHELGDIIFLPTHQNEKGVAVFLLGDVISTLQLANTALLIGAGTRVSIKKVAHTKKQPLHQIESILKSIERDHSEKDTLYKDIEHDFAYAIENALKHAGFMDDSTYSCTFVGESFMLPIIEDTFSSYKNIHFTQIYKDANARLSYLIKNKVQ